MIKYHTNFFINGTFDDIGEWLNSFEQERNGRPQCNFNIDIEEILVTSDGVLFIIKVFSLETIPQTDSSS
jgi:allantoicase